MCGIYGGTIIAKYGGVDVLTEYQNGVILKVSDENGIIIGSVRAHIENDTVCIGVGKLIEHPKKQGQGIGTKLLFAIEKEYPNHRYELFTSTRSKRNIENISENIVMSEKKAYNNAKKYLL